uniref:Uncharacterized protein n=1 Tax=Amphimedon queenslandica TaxID=400682 RepID=A0A1X7UAG6_AMPQE
MEISHQNDLSIHSFNAEKLKIQYSATEMLLMACIFPFLVEVKVPEDDLKHNCFLILLKILRLALTSFVSSDIAAYLRVLIAEHHVAFTTIYIQMKPLYQSNTICSITQIRFLHMAH